MSRRSTVYALLILFGLGSAALLWRAHDMRNAQETVVPASWTNSNRGDSRPTPATPRPTGPEPIVDSPVTATADFHSMHNLPTNTAKEAEALATGGWAQLPSNKLMRLDQMLIARVRVVEILPPKTNTVSGVVPTRDPAVSLGDDYPSEDKIVVVPIRLEVLELFRSEIPGIDGIVVAERHGYAADFWLTDEQAFDIASLEVGDIGILMARRRPDISPIRYFLDTWAIQASSEDELIVSGVTNRWYLIDGDIAKETRGYPLPIATFEAELRSALPRP